MPDPYQEALRRFREIDRRLLDQQQQRANDWLSKWGVILVGGRPVNISPPQIGEMVGVDPLGFPLYVREVTGTTNVESTATARSLLQRAWESAQRGDFITADSLARQAQLMMWNVRTDTLPSSILDDLLGGGGGGAAREPSPTEIALARLQAMLDIREQQERERANTLATLTNLAENERLARTAAATQALNAAQYAVPLGTEYFPGFEPQGSPMAYIARFLGFQYPGTRVTPQIVPTGALAQPSQYAQRIAEILNAPPFDYDQLYRLAQV